MSKNCRIEFVEGELTCLCNHRDIRNCDLYEDDEENDSDGTRTSYIKYLTNDKGFFI